MFKLPLVVLLSIIAASTPSTFAAPTGDDIHWSPQFGPPGVTRFTAGMHASAEGQIIVSQHCAPETNCPVQFWDGRSWRSIGIMSGGQHLALAIEKRDSIWYLGGVFDSVDGTLMNNIATWDGVRWSPMGAGLPQGAVQTMAFYKNELYVGGWPTQENTTFIRKWNGSEWIDLAAPFNSVGFEVTNVLLSDGNYLYAGGDFSLDGANVARWDGTQWEAVGTRLIDGSQDSVLSLASYNGELYAVVNLTVNLNRSIGSIWKWNGNVWTKLSATFRGGGPTSLLVWNDSLYVNGSFTNINSQTARGLVRYQDEIFQPLPGIASPARPQGTPNAIYFAGQFSYLANSDSGTDWLLASGVGLWDGTAYDNIYSPEFSNGVGLVPSTFAHLGDKLYVGGTFLAAGDASANSIAAWDGRAWSGLGSGIQNRTSTVTRVNAIQPLGNDLFVGGLFTHAGGQPANNVAIWDGQLWRPAGAGFNSGVNTIVAHNGRIYAGGTFSRSGSETVFFYAAWNGASWEEVGCCLGAPVDGGVTRATVMNDRLFIGGRLFGGDLGGATITNTVFELVNGEFIYIGGFDRSIASMTSLDGELYVSGDFQRVEGQPIRYLAKWDGTGWSAVGSQLNVGPSTMTVHKGKLHIGGIFTNSVTVSNLNRIARLDGDWEPLGSGVRNGALPSRVQALHSMGDDLFVGGIFLQAGVSDSLYFARWNEDINFYSSVGGGEIRFHQIAVENGSITIRCEGPAMPMVLEASTNLRDWTPLATFNGTIDHSAPQTTRFQFFRARSQ